MEKKTIIINRIELVYFEVNSDAKETIFFIHGNSVSSISWKKQLSSELLNAYRLVAIDLPAHGDSGASSNEEHDYNLAGFGLIMANAIKELAGDKPYLLAGISLGTNILAEALAFDLHPMGIVLGGSCIVGGAYTVNSFVMPNTNVHVVFSAQSSLNEVSQYASQVMLSTEEDDVNDFISDYYRVKVPVRSTLADSIGKQQYSNEIALIKSIHKPVLLIFGKDELIVDPDYLDDASLNLWKGLIFKLPGASHLVHIDQPEVFNSLLADYAKDMFG